jgi:hypothetical protein
MDTLKMKAKHEMDSTPPIGSAPDDRDPVSSDHPPPPAKLPSWRPTVPGVQPRPTLHGVQPLITLRGLSAPTEHDMPIQRDTPHEAVDLALYPRGTDLPEVPPTSMPGRGNVALESDSSDSGQSFTSERFERALRVRRWSLGIAVALGTFALVVAAVVLFGSPSRGKHALRAPSPVEPAPRNHRALGADEIVPAPPPVAELAALPSEPSPAPEADILATSIAPTPEPPDATVVAKKPLSSPAAPSRPNLFSQVPARPGVD